MVDFGKAKEYFRYIFGVIGIVFFWAGVWDGVGNIWLLKNPLVSLVVGFFLLALSGFLFKGGHPLWGEMDDRSKVFHQIKKHPQKEQFHIKYFDKNLQKAIPVSAAQLQSIEKRFLVFIFDHGEVFIPFDRIQEILHKGTVHWRAKP